MSMLLRMAWRNLWRRKRRTLITISSVAFGAVLGLTAVSVGNYMDGAMIEASARAGLGHVSVRPAGFADSPSIEKRIQKAEELRSAALGLEGVGAAAIRIIGQAMFASAARTVGGTFIAVDPRQENREIDIYWRAMIEGKTLEDASGRGAMVGRLLAEKLGLGLGKKLVYTAVDVNGEMVSDVARVVGVFATGVDEIDGGTVVLSIDQVRQAVGYAPDEATMVAVFARDHLDAGSIDERLSAAVRGRPLEVETWEATQPELAGLLTVNFTVNTILEHLLGLLIAAGVLNTVLMSVLERKRELGVLMAVGLLPGQLTRLVLAESLLIGVVGAIAGSALFAPWYNFLHNTGIDVSATVGKGYEAPGVMLEPVIRANLQAGNASVVLIELLLLTVLAGLYPAWSAGRAPPVESIKTI